MALNSPAAVGRVGPYRTVHLSRVIDPSTEKRRCQLRRKLVDVFGVKDYHTDLDIMTHLGTHVEAPFHHDPFTKDVTAFPPDYYAGRGVLLKLETCEAGKLVRRADLEAADRDRVRKGDIVVLDSPFHSEPFVADPNDKRPHFSRATAEWLVEKGARAVGFGDGIAIEHNVEHCVAAHDILLAEDILFLEVLRNIDQIEASAFLIIYLPLPIIGLDASPVNIMVFEGIAGFS